MPTSTVASAAATNDADEEGEAVCPCHPDVQENILMGVQDGDVERVTEMIAAQWMQSRCNAVTFIMAVYLHYRTLKTKADIMFDTWLKWLNTEAAVNTAPCLACGSTHRWEVDLHRAISTIFCQTPLCKRQAVHPEAMKHTLERCYSIAVEETHKRKSFLPFRLIDDINLPTMQWLMKQANALPDIYVRCGGDQNASLEYWESPQSDAAVDDEEMKKWRFVYTTWRSIYDPSLLPRNIVVIILGYDLQAVGFIHLQKESLKEKKEDACKIEVLS